MPARSRLRPLLAALVAAAPAVSAAAASPLPIAADVRVGPDALGATLVHGGPDGMGAPPNPACAVPLGEQARAAWSAAVRRLFGGADGAPRLAVEVPAVRGELELSASGWKAVVSHDALLRDGEGAELARWTLRGDSPVVGADAPALQAAFARAAAAAAARFERDFADAPAVAAWLAARGISAPPSPRRLARAPVRDGWTAFAEGGVGIPPSDETRNAGWAARAGFSAGVGRLGIVLGVGLSQWSMPVGAGPAPGFPLGFPSGAGELSVSALDVDFGVAFRAVSFLELSAGMGASLVGVEGTAPYSLYPPEQRVGALAVDASERVGTYYAAAHLVFPVSPRVRLRAGLEARGRTGPTLHYDELPEDLRVHDAPVRVLVGLEVALARPAPR